MTTPSTPARFKDLCLDAVDIEQAARFWAPTLGLKICRSDTELWLDGPTEAHRIWINEVPEPKTAKNRVHLDLHVGPQRAAGEVERLTALGATVAWTTSDRGPVTTTMRDPEGNELCVS